MCAWPRRSPHSIGPAEVELAAEPVRRLSDVVAEYDRLEAQVRELDDRNASAIGAWIASGREGPAPDDDTDAKSLTARMVSPTAQRGRVVALFGNRRPDGAASALRAPAPRSAAPAYPPNVEVLSAHRRDVGFRRQS